MFRSFQSAGTRLGRSLNNGAAGRNLTSRIFAQRIPAMLATMGVMSMGAAMGAVAYADTVVEVKDGDSIVRINMAEVERNIPTITPWDAAEAKKAGSLPAKDLAKYIDHTVLAAKATYQDVQKLCNEAKEYGFFSVCVNSCWVPECVKLLQGSDVAVCSVVGFPLGAMCSAGKAAETKEAVRLGATEIDMVINVGRVKMGDWQFVEDDIASVVKAAGGKALVKVIFETCLLTDEEVIQACKASVRAEANYVKTSTGFSTAGASLKHVKMMRANVPPTVGVKASGGIRDAKAVREYIEAGATRIGASKGVKIVSGGVGGAGY